MGILIRWIILTIAIIVASYLLEGIHISGFFSAFFAAAALGILNALFRPILLILTLPINVLTLGTLHLYNQRPDVEDGIGHHSRI